MIKILTLIAASLLLTIGWFWLQPTPDIPDGYTRDFPDTKEENDAPTETDVLISQSGEHIPFRRPPENETTNLTADSVLFAPAADARFDILYYEPESRLVVNLLEEPLGESRAAAELYIVNSLGLSPEVVCTLNTRVLTSRFVSNFYADQELGFSFCPGAVPLP